MTRIHARALALAVSVLGACASAAAAPALTRADVDRAIAQFKPVLENALQQSGLPGLAVGVVFQDEVAWIGCYGVREVGKPARIDADSMFQLASISKPVGATLIARLVGEGRVRWNDPIVDHLPSFALADAWTTQHATIADMYAHRSGLPDHAVDDLEEYGYTQAQILARLPLEALAPFRAGFAYTNYGLTAAAEAAVSTIGMSWEDASRELLYRPAGMNATTSRFDEYLAAPDRAVPHVMHRDGHWSADFVQDPSQSSPAAGVASTVNDMTRWMRLQLNGGVIDGTRIVDQNALAATHEPLNLQASAQGYSARATHYGLGWFVYADDAGQMRWTHAGSFALGAATNTTLVPAQKLGIVILTNGFPIGVAEGMTESFLEFVMTGTQSRDWYASYRAAYDSVLYPFVQIDYRQPPSGATPPRMLESYLGTYSNDYIGQADVELEGDHLAMKVGPARRTFSLRHWSGNTFWYTPPGEFGVAASPVTFAFDGRQVRMTWGKRQDDGSFADDPHGPLVRTLPCPMVPPMDSCTPP